MDVLRRGRGVLARPFGLVIEHDGHAGFRQLGAEQSLIRKRAQITAQFAHVPERLGILPRMRQHRGMELLRAGPGLAPLEVAHGIGSHGHVRQGIAHQLAGFLAIVDWSPVHGRGGMLHQEPRILAGDAVHQRSRERELVQMRLARNEVMVIRHEIDLAAPIVVIQYGTAGGDHEVGGLRLGGDLEQGFRPMRHVRPHRMTSARRS